MKDGKSFLEMLEPFFEHHRTQERPLKSIRQQATFLETSPTQLSRLNHKKAPLTKEFAEHIATRLGRNPEEQDEVRTLLRLLRVDKRPGEPMSLKKIRQERELLTWAIESNLKDVRERIKKLEWMEEHYAFIVLRMNVIDDD